MKEIFNFIIDSRKAFVRLLDELTLDELNAVPEGFNNNIIWNFGHIVVSTQTLCYVRTGILQDKLVFKYVEAYEKGSKPSYYVGAAEVQELKELALSSIQQIEADYLDGRFKTIQPYATSTYNAQLTQIEDVIITSIGHDNLHFGYALAQRRMIKKQQ